jgi:hypothetical protein
VLRLHQRLHDAANSIATVVSTRVLSPGQAVAWAAFFNFAAAFLFGTAVAKTVGSGMIDLGIVTFAVIAAGLVGAIVWDLITWYFGLPTSSSHALFGGYAGAAVAKAGFGAIIASGWTKTLIFIVVAPAIGLTVGLTVMTALYWIFRRTPPQRVDGWFRRLQLVSAAGFSLMHGANDAQKTMGIVAGVLFTGGYISTFEIPAVGRAGGLHRDRARHALGRLAHHPHDGHQDHQAPAGLGVRRGDRRRGGDLHRDRARRGHQHHPHDHRRDRRRRRDAAPVGGALGCRGADRLGVAPHDPRVRRDRRDELCGARRVGWLA